MKKPGILEEILKHKETEVAGRRALVTDETLIEGIKTASPPRVFSSAIIKDRINIIAEVKKGSPSKGIIRSGFDPLSIARTYEENGAAAISVLTDEKYFFGSFENLVMIRREVALPLLRKDFIIDPYQIYEARSAGADAVLLIAAALPKKTLSEFITLTESLGMAALVEVHTEDELFNALEAGATIIGINNRDLNTFKTDIATTARLAKLIPPGKIVVSESGINTYGDVKRLLIEGVKTFLVGEALVREKDVGRKLRELRGVV
ncbi:MAG: indole-3-glycerol phosphate synthase TrpC [Thermodesulfobacteriota bacterium]